VSLQVGASHIGAAQLIAAKLGTDNGKSEWRRHRQKTANTRQLTPDNPKQTTTTDSGWTRTTNKYHRQIHPTNKTNTRQPIRVEQKC
jgi:hypothetical protein